MKPTPNDTNQTPEAAKLFVVLLGRYDLSRRSQRPRKPTNQRYPRTDETYLYTKPPQ